VCLVKKIFKIILLYKINYLIKRIRSNIELRNYLTILKIGNISFKELRGLFLKRINKHYLINSIHKSIVKKIILYPLNYNSIFNKSIIRS
jgi:hypothetical protein